MIMKALIVVLLLTVCFLESTSAKFVYLNSTTITNCTAQEQCWFFEPSLWTDEAVPAENDEVLIEGFAASYYMFLNTSITLTGLTILADFHLQVSSYANVSISNITLFGAKISLQDQAQVYGLESTELLEGSEMSINGRAFAQEGDYFYLDETSSIWVFDSGYLGLHSTTMVIKGGLSISPSAMFVATGGVIEFINKTFSFQVTPIIYYASFVNSQITFKQGLRGSLGVTISDRSTISIENSAAAVLNGFTVDELSTLYIVGIASCTLINQNITGTLFISSSNVKTTNLTALGPLTIGGATTINASTIRIRTISFQNGVNGEAANLTINTDYLEVYGEIDIPQATITVTQSASFGGPIHIEGSVNVGGTTYVKASALTVQGDINIGYLYGQLAQNAGLLSVEEAQLTADNIRIGNYSTFVANNSQITGNVTLFHNATLQHHGSDFVGYIHNHGYIEVRYQLNIGNYTQGESGVLLSYVELANRSSGYLNVAGHASIDGKILYSVGSMPTKDDRTQLVIIQTTNGITGRFAADPVDVSNSKQRGSLVYSHNDAYLSFGKAPEDASSLWWIWIIIPVAILAILGLVILLVKTMRKRKDYTPVA